MYVHNLMLWGPARSQDYCGATRVGRAAVACLCVSPTATSTTTTTTGAIMCSIITGSFVLFVHKIDRQRWASSIRLRVFFFFKGRPLQSRSLKKKKETVSRGQIVIGANYFLERTFISYSILFKLPSFISGRGEFKVVPAGRRWREKVGAAGGAGFRKGWRKRKKEKEEEKKPWPDHEKLLPQLNSKYAREIKVSLPSERANAIREEGNTS